MQKQQCALKEVFIAAKEGYTVITRDISGTELLEEGRQNVRDLDKSNRKQAKASFPNV